MNEKCMIFKRVDNETEEVSALEFAAVVENWREIQEGDKSLGRS